MISVVVVVLLAIVAGVVVVHSAQGAGEALNTCTLETALQKTWGGGGERRNGLKAPRWRS